MNTLIFILLIVFAYLLGRCSSAQQVRELHDLISDLRGDIDVLGVKVVGLLERENIKKDAKSK